MPVPTLIPDGMKHILVSLTPGQHFIELNDNSPLPSSFPDFGRRIAFQENFWRTRENPCYLQDMNGRNHLHRKAIPVLSGRPRMLELYKGYCSYATHVKTLTI